MIFLLRYEAIFYYYIKLIFIPIWSEINIIYIHKHNKQIQITYKLKLCYKLKKITSDSGFGERLHEKILQIEHFASDRTEISLQIANYFNSYSGFRFKSRLTPLYLAGHFNQIFKLNYSERKIRFKSLEKVASHIKINFALKEF